MIRNIADRGDPFMQGAIWMLDQLTKPSPTAGAFSSQEDS